MREESSAWRSPYWVVLGLVVVSYGACAAQLTPDPGSIALLVQLLTIAVAFRAARMPPRIQHVTWMVTGFAGLVVIAGALLGLRGAGLDLALSAASMVAYVSAPVAILLDQVRRPLSNASALLAVVSAYLMVGMVFTFAYNLFALVSPVPTFGEDHVDSLSNQLFFSFTTLTTTGFGNLVPVSPAVQSVAILEAITGQLFLLIGVARILNLHLTRTVEPVPREGRNR
ncbi:ion channel [Microbacterium caowuchunii]|uniref:ion channel n=1 Tax=Microbacterium caowuchunii TaxID=2614638 RepID=UPI001EE8B628|nr:ion channel [Microbacterium caowuchunii]